MRTWCNISLSAYQNFWINLRQSLRPETRLMAVVKANGYGLGAIPLAAALETTNLADWFGVATIDEAIALRANGIQRPILLLSEPHPDGILSLLTLQIDCVVYTDTFIHQLNREALNRGLTAGVHLKIDTGMNRLGCLVADSFDLVTKIQNAPGLTLNGMMSHLACSDMPDHPLNQSQLSTFESIIQALNLSPCVLRHIANSAAVRHFPAAHWDMVRIGIDSYVDIVSLHARVLRVHGVVPGDSVSYGATFIADHATQIATIAIGYADGVPRSFRGDVLIHGHRCPVVGPVCMDMLMVDVGELAVSVGDTATLVGQDGSESIPLAEYAAASGRITYEALTGLGNRVIREIQP